MAYEFPQHSQSFDTAEKMAGLLVQVFEPDPVRQFALAMTVPPVIVLLWLAAKHGLKDRL
jgi:hypothetical protein